MQRFIQYLQLPNDEKLIRAYCEEHSRVWPIIKEGIREVGITDMQIFHLGTHVVMIMETTDDFDWERDNARLARLPQQAEWEAHVARLQGADPNATSTEKWTRMERIFKL
ncbi:MAG: L-rhamnose mutarotase [Bacteroidales bacterium]|nr:L-rhamnose mutarotase [Bacteroidales bacterium]